MLEIVINCLRLFVVVIYSYHGDGSDGRHVCLKYHGHTHYCLLEIVINCLRLFVVVIYGNGSAYVYKVSQPYALLSGYYVVVNCLRLFVVVISWMVYKV